MQTPNAATTQLGRRAFMKNGVLVLSAAAVTPASLISGEPKPGLKIGLVTDLHYADKASSGTRHYRETPDKLAEAATELAKHKPSFLVELGDFIDAADSVKTELGYLKRIHRDFSAICKQRHHVLGNHCVYTLKKQEFLETVGQKKSYYSFDSGNFHFIVLDSCFRSDGQPYGRKNFEWTDPNIPAAEIDWLRADLKATSKKTVVFAHQRLDVSSVYGVKNAPVVRKLLEDSGQVLAVFQGHSHENDHKEIGGIHYCTMVAMIEGSGAANNGYSIMSLADDGTIHLKGFRKQSQYDWPA
ncbi:MAG TPA: alkaline phosphatase [Planctomycetaceae bacterium]|nr:alkaline phosphatase [Planctomycetaceae bacterium]|tara:strand:- start:2563 stop:3459 length:897 start_codon:yes stop_codon:yes gene_type:complete